MTDEQIIKAFDNLLNRKWIIAESNGRFITLGDVADLIHRQKAEIERLHRLFVSFTNELCLWIDVNKYDSTGLPIRDMVDESDNITANIKAEAIKEFAERLQSRCSKQQGCLWSSDVGAVLNEMVGDNNE